MCLDLNNNPEGLPHPQAQSNPQKELPGSENQFKVEVRYPDLILKAIKETGQQRKECQLGSTFLDNPLKNVDVYTKSDENQYSLRSYFHFDTETATIEGRDKQKKYQEKMDSSLIDETVFRLKNNSEFTFIKNKKSLIVTTKNGNRFSIDISPFVGIQKLVVTTDTIPFSSQEDFIKNITDFSKINEGLINAAYTILEIPKTDNVLVIGPPLLSKDTQPSSPFSDLFGSQKESQSKIESLLGFEKPNVTFDQIGGQKDAKEEIQGLSLAIKKPELYKKWGTKPPKGILFFSPTGTGKTLMAKALAHESNAEFMNINISDILSKYMGESEQTIANIFKHCMNNKNKRFIIFFDEIDSIATNRDRVTSEHTVTITSTLLSHIDGMVSTDNITIIGCTNRLESMDPAFIRPGRLDRLIEVPLPDENGRKELFYITTEKAIKTAERNLFLENIDWGKIARETDGLSGADIAEIIRRTLEKKAKLDGSGQNPDPVSAEDILNQIKKYERISQAKKTIGFAQ